MRYTKIGPTVLAVAMVSFAAVAQPRNLQQPDQIFTEPHQGALSIQAAGQVLATAGDLIMMRALFPKFYPEAAEALAAQNALNQATDLPLSEDQRSATLEALSNDPANLQSGGSRTLKPSAQARIDGLRSASIVTVAEKQKAVDAAIDVLNKARKQALGVFGVSARLLGSALFFADGAGRVYVWFWLDANPTVSPAYTFLMHQLDAHVR